MPPCERDKQKIGEIELMRFFFSIVIMLFHSSYIFDGAIHPFPAGRLAVEYFFIVSGYLMMSSITKRDSRKKISRSTQEFIKKKALALFPYWTVAYTIGLLVIKIAQDMTLKEFIRYAVGCWGEFFFLRQFGILENSVNLASWYVSSMLICMFALYPLLCKYQEAMCNIVLPMLTLFLLGYICVTYGKLSGPVQWIGFTYKGNLRALAEISLGVLSYRGCKLLTRHPFSKSGKTIINSIKVVMYAGCFWYMYSRNNSRLDFLIVMALCAAIVCSFARPVEMLNCKLVYGLGKMSLAIYFTHYYYAENLSFLLPPGLSTGAVMCIYVFCTVSTSIIVMILGGFGAKICHRMLFAIKNTVYQDA